MDSCSCAPMDFFFWLFLETRMMCTHVHYFHFGENYQRHIRPLIFHGVTYSPLKQITRILYCNASPLGRGHGLGRGGGHDPFRLKLRLL